MAFKISKYNNLIKVQDGVVELVKQDSSDPLYMEYVEYLQEDGVVEQSELFAEEEESAALCPNEVALWKLRFILKQMNIEDSISEKLNELPEPQKTAANYIWNYGNAIDRHSPTIMYLQSVLGLTDTQVNNIFIQSNSIVL